MLSHFSYFGLSRKAWRFLEQGLYQNPSFEKAVKFQIQLMQQEVSSDQHPALFDRVKNVFIFSMQILDQKPNFYREQ